MSNISVKNDVDLIIKQDNTINSIVAYMPEHKNMLATIASNLPEIKRASSLFGKTQSQFMDNIMTVSHFTPLRNARQVQAEIEKIRGALADAHFKHEKKKIEQRRKTQELENCKNPFDIELLELEIDEIGYGLEESRKYISGAIRQMTNYIDQYNFILESTGKKSFTEEDFESEEEAYHISKAFSQAVSAARSRNGQIDEGNHIYFEQLGINGAAAQFYINNFFLEEQNILASGDRIPTAEFFNKFIDAMIKQFSGCSKAMTDRRGMLHTNKTAMLLTGDTSLVKSTT